VQAKLKTLGFGLAAKWQIKHLHKIELPTQAAAFAGPLPVVETPHSPRNRNHHPMGGTPTLSIRHGFGAIGTFAMATGNGNSNAFNDDRFG